MMRMPRTTEGEAADVTDNRPHGLACHHELEATHNRMVGGRPARAEGEEQVRMPSRPR